jgi:hypothetical protein
MGANGERPVQIIVKSKQGCLTKIVLLLVIVVLLIIALPIVGPCCGLTGLGGLACCITPQVINDLNKKEASQTTAPPTDESRQQEPPTHPERRTALDRSAHFKTWLDSMPKAEQDATAMIFGEKKAEYASVADEAFDMLFKKYNAACREGGTSEATDSDRAGMRRALAEWAIRSNSHVKDDDSTSCAPGTPTPTADGGFIEGRDLPVVQAQSNMKGAS